MSPMSRPTLAGSLTPTPTSSNPGWSSTSAITILPTNPVPQMTTRLASESVRTAITLGPARAAETIPAEVGGSHGAAADAASSSVTLNCIVR